MVETLLDDVVAVQILDEADNVRRQRRDDRRDLVLGREEVDHLLDRPGTVHVQGDVDELLGYRLADDVPLLVRRVLEELLAQIVAERIFRSRVSWYVTALRK